MKSDIFQYLPSKKFIITVVSVLIAGLGIFLALSQKGLEKSREIFPSGTGFFQMFSGDNQKDSDNDGLKDWEEALWKTDINNPDTDKDGAPDGEEVKSGRDPLKPGPNDKIEAKIFSAEEDLGGLTKTDAASRDFFAYFYSLFQTGNLNAETKEALTQSFLQNIEREKLADKYNLSDLNITASDSVDTLGSYGNEVARIMNQGQSPSGENEIQIIQNALQKESEKDLQKLDAVIAVYRNVSNELLKVKAPKGVSLYHLNVVNGSNNIAEALVNIKKVFGDSLQGVIGFKQYQDELSEARKALADISRHFLEKGAIFYQNEAGYKFFIDNRAK